MSIRAAILAIVMLLAPQAALADYLDVITTRLGDCTLEKYLGLVEEFRGVMKQQGYKYTVEIAEPLVNDPLDVIYWIGRAPDFATFGAEYTRWESQIVKGGTPEAKINDKLNACGENVTRSGHQIR